MGLLDQARETVIPEFLLKVQVAMCAAAIAIQNEAPLTMLAADVTAAATSITLAVPTGFALNDIVQYGSGAAAESRKMTAFNSGTGVATVSAVTATHKAGEPVIKLVPNSINRRNYAKLILNSPQQYAALFAAAIVAQDATLTLQNDGTMSDTAINAAVSAVFNALAGTV